MPYASGVGHANTDTSYQAAVDIKPKASTLRETVLTFMRKNNLIRFSTEDIAEHTNLLYREVQPRVSELRSRNKIRDSGFRTTGCSGKAIILWEIVSNPD